MNDHLPDPPRWKETTGQASLAERSAGEAVRAWGQPEPLTPAALGRIAAGLRAPRTRRLPRLLPVAAALLLGIATAASAAHLDLLPGWLGGGQARWGSPHDSPSVQPSRGRGARAVRPPPAVPAPAPSPPADVVAPEPAAHPSKEVLQPAPNTPPPARGAIAPRGALPRRGEVVATPPAVTAEPPAAAPPTVPEDPTIVHRVPERAPGTRMAWLAPPEQRPAAPAAPANAKAAVPPAVVPGGQAAKQLAEAIRLLRADGKPAQALAVLDAEAPALHRQGLGHESLILRVEALLVLGRNAEALRLLDGTSLSEAAASHALLVTRGKLRAAANRCADAVGDFTLVVAESRTPDRQALSGRAVCRHRLGDVEGAREDLARYRRAFPDDPHLPALERRLGGGH